MKPRRTKPRENRIEWLISSWEYLGSDSWIVHRVRRAKHGIEVHAMCKLDFEVAKASRVKWDGKSLSYELYWPSTGYRTRNKLTPVSVHEVVHECTHRGVWINTEYSRSPRAEVTGFVGAKKCDTKMDLLVGYWEGQGSPGNMVYDIRRRRSGKLGVRVTCEVLSDKFRVSKQSYDGKALDFDVIGPGTGWRYHVRLLPKSGRRLVLEETNWETMRCLGYTVP